MTAPDRDPVVAALDRVEKWLQGNDSCELPGWHETLWAIQNALPLARAQAALVAADVERQKAWDAYMFNSGDSFRREHYASSERHLAALAEYRRALEAK